MYWLIENNCTSRDQLANFGRQFNKMGLSYYSQVTVERHVFMLSFFQTIAPEPISLVFTSKFIFYCVHLYLKPLDYVPIRSQRARCQKDEYLKIWDQIYENFPQKQIRVLPRRLIFGTGLPEKDWLYLPCEPFYIEFQKL